MNVVSVQPQEQERDDGEFPASSSSDEENAVSILVEKCKKEFMNQLNVQRLDQILPVTSIFGEGEKPEYPGETTRSQLEVDICHSTSDADRG